MPTDTFYGSECEMRAGVQADATTAPTTWEYMPFVSFTPAPQRERRDRPQIGLARANSLDPTKPIPGFLRMGGDLVVDADGHRLPRWLRMALGAPATSGPSSSLYTHVWSSGAKTQSYFGIQIKTGASEWRQYLGLQLATLGAQFGGENVRDFNVSLGLRGLGRVRDTSPLGSTPSAMVSESLMNRAILKVDDAAVSNTIEGAWNWDRGIQEDIFLSTAAEVTGLRPGPASHSGSAKFRAVAGAFDTLEEADTPFDAKFEMIGVTAGHVIRYQHLQCLLSAPSIPITGLGQIERDVSWSAYQTSANPAAKITVINDVASYAS